MFQDYEVYQIYEHIAIMCDNPDPSEGCRLVISFCVNEMKKIADIAYQQAHSPDANHIWLCVSCRRINARHKNKCRICGRRR